LPNASTVFQYTNYIINQRRQTRQDDITNYAIKSYQYFKTKY